MERIHQFQCVATEKIQACQKDLDAKGYGHLGYGAAGILMFFVFCPMSIVTVAATYWTYSSEAQGVTASAKASLWEISASTEIRGVSSESEVKMCGDEMQGFDDCGKIDAVRFFVITALLLSLASALAFVIGFSPKLKPTAALRRKMAIAGVSLAAVVLVWIFLSVCIAASIDMTDNYNLNGAGFVFLVLELFVVTLAIVLAVRTMTRWSAIPQPAAEAQAKEAAKSHPQAPAASPSTPTLLTVVGASAEGVAEAKTNNDVIPAQKKETE